jgi:hypothetical protein
MASGAFLPFGSISAAIADAISYTDFPAQANSPQLVTQGPWTPPQYALPAVTILTVPATIGSNYSTSITFEDGVIDTTTPSTAAPIYEGTAAINYVFDGVLRLAHKRTLVKTQHPVLTGANISDHAYMKPSRVTMDIIMSDAMAPFKTGLWTGSSTKSVSAWQILKNLQINRTLLTLTTRLDTYYNMLIEDLSAPDDYKTGHGLRCTIVLEELIAASVSSTGSNGASSRSQTTGNTPSGTIQSVAPNPSQIQQNAIPSTLWPNTPTYPNVPGAGVVSSNSLGQVPTE